LRYVPDGGSDFGSSCFDWIEEHLLAFRSIQAGGVTAR